MTLKRILQTVALPLLVIIVSCQGLYAQDKIVTGKVTDSKDGTPVAGVSIVPKGSKTGTTTGNDGTFRIKMPSGITVIVVTSVGYAKQEIDVSSSAELNISLAATGGNLNEVVVIGYGTARKRDLTGSITSVTSKDFVKGPITTPEQLISGKVAGVQINSNSGQPGAGSRIRIRGGTSLNASNEPLIVIDGVPLDNNRNLDGTSRIAGAPDPLALINPNDIESFNVLKDASAAAIYGSRAANGVIIITTKKGRKGNKLNISFSSLNTVAVKTGTVDVLSAKELSDYVNAKGSSSEKALLGTANTDWQSLIYRSAFSTDNNISLNGGIKQLPYRLSLGFLNQDGILKRDNIKRYNVSLNLSPVLLQNHLSVNLNTKYTHNDNFYANQSAIGSAVYFDPTKPVYNNTSKYGGYYEWTFNNALNGLAGKNPLGLLNQQQNKSSVDRFLGNVQLDYKLHFLPDLRFNLNLGYDWSKGGGTTFVPAIAAADSARGGRFTQYEQTKTNKLLEFYLNYVKNLKEIKSRIDFIAGYSFQDWETKSPSFADLRADRTEYAKASAPYQAQNTIISFYGRLNYALMNRYLVTFTLRRDGSSKFSKDNRWGNFPSAAVAWSLMEENFMKKQKVFSNLKLRLGWGITGQQDGIYEYAYQPNYFYGDSGAQYQFGNQYVPVVRPNAYDANLKWEETESRNAGIDIGLAKGRVNLSVDYYSKSTRDLLASVPVAAGTNFSDKITTNVGSISNQGLETVLNAAVIQHKDFSLDLGYNITWIIDSKITKLRLVSDPTYLGTPVGGSGGFNNVQIQSVGYRPYTFFLYRQVYGKDGKPLEGVYADINRDGLINDFDKIRERNPEPNVFMGFTANATYKRLSAGFVMRASLDNYVFNGVKNTAVYQNIYTGQNFLNNTNHSILETGFHDRQIFSDYYLENGSFLRMDNAYLSYDFGKPFRNKDIRLRMSFNCQNVFVITKYTGLDPEINGGIDNTIYPRPRMYAVGVNLDF
ncbi:MAG: SusC/RagA family TonB-linked outer membrane protein [Sphingobacteriales bacterium]